MFFEVNEIDKGSDLYNEVAARGMKYSDQQRIQGSTKGSCIGLGLENEWRSSEPVYT